MEEIEANPEQAQEDLHHHAQHAGSPWVSRVALTSAFIAALAAVSSMLAAHHSNEGAILQLRASDKWNEYQAKKQKSLAVATKIETFEKQYLPVKEEDRKYLERHAEQEKDLMAEAKALQEESAVHLHRHHPLAVAVTLFQVAIAISAISVLSKRPAFWYVSLCFGVAGIAFFALGLLHH